MPIIEIAAIALCSTCVGFLIGKYPPLPEYMTRDADRPVRARVERARANLIS